MFGLFYTLLTCGTCCVKGIRDNIENERYKQNYCDNETGIYYDRSIKKHDKITGKIVTYQQDNDTKDMWIVDVETCKPIRNITLLMAEQHYQEEKQKFLTGKTNKTYVRYGNDIHSKDKCIGVRFKDLLTGKIYVMRTIVEWDRSTRKFQTKKICDCLMDIETGKYIRPSDLDIFYTIYNGKTTNKLYEEIEKANKEKEKILQKKMRIQVLQSEYDNYFYSNYCRVNNSYELNEEQSNYPLKEKEIQIKKELGIL